MPFLAASGGTHAGAAQCCGPAAAVKPLVPQRVATAVSVGPAEGAQGSAAAAAARSRRHRRCVAPFAAAHADSTCALVALHHPTTIATCGAHQPQPLLLVPRGPTAASHGTARTRRWSTVRASAAPPSAAAPSDLKRDLEEEEEDQSSHKGEGSNASEPGNGSSNGSRDAAAAAQQPLEAGANGSAANGNGSGVLPGMAAQLAAAVAAAVGSVSGGSTATSATTPAEGKNGAASTAPAAPSSSAPDAPAAPGSNGSNGNGASSGGEALAALQQQLQQMREAVEDAQRERLEAQARAQQAELKSQEAQDAMAQAQELYTDLNRQYSELCEQLEALKSSRQGSSAGSPSAAGGGAELGKQVEDLQAQLEDMDYRLGWALRDLRAHQLVLRAQGELSLHLSGLPHNLQQQVFDQIDNGAELLGDGGSATVHAVTINGKELAVKVMPLFDINTARPYHFRDITTCLLHELSPYIEMPLHTFLRLKDDEVEGTQYFLYTVWPRRHMDVDQLLCTRALQNEEIMTVMHHTVLALQDLAKARMVHADVKPPNVLVMLGPDGLVSSAHLTDFGSVQYVPQGEDASPAIWDGQLAWNWPPEQREWVHLEACDAWGLALLYSCMKVCNPSKPDVTDVLQDMNSKNQAEFDRVRDQELLPEDPRDPPEMRSLTRLMRRCVAKDPKKRPGIRELVGGITVLREQMQMQKRAAAAAARGGR